MSASIDFTKYAVLYVDDEEQALKYFRRGFEKQFRILTAINVAQAMVILEDPASRIGVVISDQRMPGKSGVELLSEVRKRWPAIVRILITAYTEIEDAVAAVNAGAVYKYINKPAEFPQLREVLTEALAVHQQILERDALATTLAALEEQRNATQAAEAQREVLQERLISASRDAGRAEVATGVLHNVGNVLNSINVSAAMMKQTLVESKVGNLCKALSMLEEHSGDLVNFLTNDDRGRVLPGYLHKLATVLADEHHTFATEMTSLERSLEHIGRVVQMQQSYAKGSTVRELVSASDLMEDAVRMNLTSLHKQNIEITRTYGQMAPVLLDKHRVLQILINLISNAANALSDRQPQDRRITFRVNSCDSGSRPFIQFQVTDNGSGISQDNLTRIFVHGFTTRKDGHGFGLHSSANAAKEMGGSLIASSGGLNQGATFTLSLPMSVCASENNEMAESIQKVAA